LQAISSSRFKFGSNEKKIAKRKKIFGSGQSGTSFNKDALLK